MTQWTISFWMILPPTVFNTDRPHVLVQNLLGQGAYIEIDESGEHLMARCEVKDRVIDSGFNLKK
jgi:hypothetical protein